MDSAESPEKLNVCRKSVFERRKPAVRVVVTDAMCYIGRSLAYRIVSDKIFGQDQDIILYLFDDSESSVFLESIAIEITASAPNILEDVVHSRQASIAFEDADYVFCIGKTREYNFFGTDFKNDPFFDESVAALKSHAMSIANYAKADVKIITLGNTAAKIISEYTPLVPKENITAATLALQNVAASAIAAKTNRVTSDIKNLIIWGVKGKYALPYCNYAEFRNGKPVMEEINDDEWFKRGLQKAIESVFHKCRIRTSESLALAEHCKYLVQGTPDDEWISMCVCSDGSYDVPPGYFFSFPVVCKNGKWNIVQGLHLDSYYRRYMKKILISIDEKVTAALNLCKEPSSRALSRKFIRKSVSIKFALN